MLEKYSNVYYRCKYIVENIDAPWSHPTLKLIFNDGKDTPTTISDDRLNEGNCGKKHEIKIKIKMSISFVQLVPFSFVV